MTSADQPPRRPAPKTSGPSTIRYRNIKTEHDRWVWHAETYAHRRVIGGVDYALHTSPVDPDGVWFDEALVAEATLRYENFYQRKNASKPIFRFTDREVRTRLQWARDQGYQTWNDFLDAVQAGDESVLPYLASYNAEFAPPDTAGTFKSLGQALGKAMHPKLPEPTIAINWLELDADGNLVEPWRAYPQPQPKRAPRSRRASYPDDPT